MKNLFLLLQLLLFCTNMILSQISKPNDLLKELRQEHCSGLNVVIPSEHSTLFNDDPPWPPDWFYPVNAGVSIHAIIVLLEANPRVNDIPLVPGDYIGVFFTDTNGELKCGGGDFWLGDENIIFSAYSDDFSNPEKTGFTYAEQMYFKVYRWDTNKDYDVDIYSFSPGSLTTDKWYPLGISEMNEIQALVDFDFYIDMSANPICMGDQLTLSAQEFIGTTGNYTFNWSSDPPGYDHTVQFPPPVTPNVNTIYLLSVSDGNLVSEHQRTVIINENPQVSVSDDGVICTGQSFPVSATAANYSSVIWTTSGDGSFSNPTAFQTNYNPGADDKANGQVTLTFTAFPLSPCPIIESNSIELIIQQLPTLEAGEDLVGCRQEVTAIEMMPSAANFSSVQWSTNGDGTFSNPNAINPLYYPGNNDLTSPFLQLTVCIEAISPCVLQLCDNFLISFINAPTCNAPNSRTRCADLPVSLAGTAANYSLIEWTTQGDGTFDNPNIFNAKYYAGPQDQIDGGNIVTLNALPVSPCTNTAFKDVNVIWKPIPTIDSFGANTDFLCPGQNFLQLDAQVNNYSSIFWTTNGNGTFSSTSILNPKYYPGTLDYQNGFFELNLTAGPVSPCNNSYTFSKNVIIAEQPQAVIVTNNGAASCGEIALEATASSAISVLWETQGDGTFSDEQSVNPVYYPGENDMASSGNIQLTFTAFPLCSQFTNSVATVQLFFSDDASVFAGENASICETVAYFLQQTTASNYENLLWTTSGDGTFNNQNILKPLYYPGSGDKNAGIVTLKLSGTSVPPCTFIAEDELTLSIFPAPVVFAGSNSTICENETAIISGAEAYNYSQLLWSSDGDGTFNNTEILNPVYFPGNEDKLAESVTLSLSTTGISPCNFVSTDTRTLTIQKLPVVSTGNDVTVCGSAVLSATAFNYSSLTWITLGDGTFSNPDGLFTVYYPGADDFVNQIVVVELTASPLDYCTVEASDQKNILINIPAVIEDNVADAEVFTTETLELSYIVSNSELGNFTWYKDGEILNEYTSESLVINGVAPDDAGLYQCVFANECGSVSSQVALIEVLEPTTQIFSFNSGWQGISTWFSPTQSSVPQLFEPVENQVVILQNDSGFWWPQGSINTLDTWSNNTGYAIKMTEISTLEISGITRYPVLAVEVPPGWSYLSVKSPCQVNVSDIFQSLPEITIVKSIAGYQLYWPQFGINTLIQLVPGKAYHILNSSAQPVNITFPDCD
jgi:hypothetical protein